MTTREKVLAGVVGGAVVLLGGSKLLGRAVLAPLESTRHSLQLARQKRDNLRQFVRAHRDVAQRWQQYTARTLSADMEQAKVAFLDRIARLLDRHGLTAKRSLAPQTPRRQKSGIVLIPLQVRISGSLESVVGFMCDLRQQPYLARLSKVTMRAAERDQARGKRGGSEPAALTLSLTATSVVLPRIPGIAHLPFDDRQPAPARLAHQPQAYQQIASVNFFEPYRPPVQVVRKPGRPANRPPAPRPRPKPRPNMVLVGVSSLNGVPRAYVRDRDHLEEPLREYFLSDRLDDGTLVAIQPKGLVVRVGAADADGRQYFFYPVGASFRQRVPWQELEPDLRRELRAQGLARAPGPQDSAPAGGGRR